MFSKDLSPALTEREAGFFVFCFLFFVLFCFVFTAVSASILGVIAEKQQPSIRYKKAIYKKHK